MPRISRVPTIATMRATGSSGGRADRYAMVLRGIAEVAAGFGTA
jgi:hypothetical protein